MRKMYETFTTIAPTSEKQLDLIDRELSDKKILEFGSGLMEYKTYLPNSSIGKKIKKRITELQACFYIPKSFQLTNEYLSNTRDGGRFIGLANAEHHDFFVKFRSLIKEPVEIAAKEHGVIVTSQCIFGAGGVNAVTSKGEKLSMTQSGVSIEHAIVDIEVEERLSLYELEALYRVVSFINALSSNDTNYKKVVVTAPKVSYYLYAFNLFEKGLLSSDLMLKWIEAVDKRSERVTRLIQKRLNKCLDVESRSPLDGIGDYFKQTISQGSQPNLEDAISILRGTDPIYKRLFEFRKPISWIDLAENISISIEELRHAFETAEGAVIVKSPKQERTFLHTERLADFLFDENHGVRLLAMYPHEQVVVAHEGSRKKALYHVKEPATISGAKKVIRRYSILK